MKKSLLVKFKSGEGMLFHVESAEEHRRVVKLANLKFKDKVESITPIVGPLRVKSISSDTMKHLNVDSIIIK